MEPILSNTTRLSLFRNVWLQVTSSFMIILFYLARLITILKLLKSCYPSVSNLRVLTNFVLSVNNSPNIVILIQSNEFDQIYTFSQYVSLSNLEVLFDPMYFLFNHCNSCSIIVILPSSMMYLIFVRRCLSSISSKYTLLLTWGEVFFLKILPCH